MNLALEPLKNESLSERFALRFEELILSGALGIGERLPSERELALQLGVSRPVVHEGLVDLAHKGLIVLKPRVGAVVNDYRKEGSLALLGSLVLYGQGRLEPRLMDDMMAMRRLIELETSRLAAKEATQEQVAGLCELVLREKIAAHKNSSALAALDFKFHHGIALASGNRIYPLLLNSFKAVYLNLSGLFYTNPEIPAAVHPLHQELCLALDRHKETQAVRIMDRILTHGEQTLHAMLAAQSAELQNQPEPAAALRSHSGRRNP